MGTPTWGSRRMSSDSGTQSQVTGPITVDVGAAFKTHLCDSPSPSVTTPREELWDVFRRMTVVRRAEIMADTVLHPSLL